MSGSVVGPELRRIFEEHGELSARLVLEESRDKSAVLYPQLEWDNEKGGEEYRLIQCGRLIRSVRVQVTRHDGEPASVRAYVHIPEVAADPLEDEGADALSGYVPQEMVGSSAELSRIALREMERRWKHLRRTYAEYAEFWTMIHAEDQAA